MKKLTSILAIFALLFTFASCTSKKSYSHDQKALSTIAATEWFSTIEYSADCFNEFKETSKSYYKLYLPKEENFSSALRLNVMEAEKNIDKRTDKFEVLPCSPTDFNSSTRQTLMDIVEDYLELSDIPVLNFDATIPADWTTELEFDEDITPEVENKLRTLYLVYLPIKVELNEKDSDDVIHTTLTTFIALPIAYGLVYDNAGVLENVDADILTLTKIEDLGTKLDKVDTNYKPEESK